MTENLIHKQLLSFSNLPLTIILKELEEQERYSECAVIKNAIESYILRFSFFSGRVSNLLF